MQDFLHQQYEWVDQMGWCNDATWMAFPQGCHGCFLQRYHHFAQKKPLWKTHKKYLEQGEPVFLYFGFRIADTIWIYLDRFCRSFFSGTWRWRHKWTKSCTQVGMSQNSDVQFFMSASEFWSRILYFNSVCSSFFRISLLGTHLSRIPWSALESQPNQGFFLCQGKHLCEMFFLRVSDWL